MKPKNLTREDQTWTKQLNQKTLSFKMHDKAFTRIPRILFAKSYCFCFQYISPSSALVSQRGERWERNTLLTVRNKLGTSAFMYRYRSWEYFYH